MKRVIAGHLNCPNQPYIHVGVYLLNVFKESCTILIDFSAIHKQAVHIINVSDIVCSDAIINSAFHVC